MGKLDGKIAIITGAGTGIGKGIARAFANEGASLVLASRNKSKLDETALELKDTPGKIIVIPTDVTVEQQVIALFDRTMDEFGRVDIMVNNAGVFDGGPLEEISLETWQKVVELGTLHCDQACAGGAYQVHGAGGQGIWCCRQHRASR